MLPVQMGVVQTLNEGGHPVFNRSRVEFRKNWICGLRVEMLIDNNVLLIDFFLNHSHTQHKLQLKIVV